MNPTDDQRELEKPKERSKKAEEFSKARKGSKKKEINGSSANGPYDYIQKIN